MVKNFVRPESHEIDTLARRLVPMAFPSEWEHRELTGRDYGIDMIIEIFENGAATGKLLSLQIKGTKNKIDKSLKEIIFDIPVNTLRYSEMFLSPVLLIICSVTDNNDVYFLWLQEYINVVLNYENPEWRLNKRTVRLKIPIENCIRGNEEKIEWIADFPKRTYEFCQFAKITSNISFELNNFSMLDTYASDDFTSTDGYQEVCDWSNSSLIKISKYIDELKSLKSIFGYKKWRSANNAYDIVILAETSAKKLYNGDYDNSLYEKSNLYNLRLLNTFFESYYDHYISRVIWETCGDHNF